MSDYRPILLMEQVIEYNIYPFAGFIHGSKLKFLMMW